MLTSTFFILLIFLCACSIAQDSDEFLDLTLNESYSSKPVEHEPIEENSCPEKLHASWLLRPPFVTMPNRSGSRNGNGVQIGGIFHEVLDLSLRKCCAILNKTGNKTAIKYKFRAADNRSMLHKDILHEEADLILPVQSDDKDKYKSYLPYLKILESPGIVLIQRSDSQYRGSKIFLLWNAIRSCWLIVVLTLLLSLIAGMCVWAMETKENTQDFGSPFYRGAFDGFWWAFVTMSTVGYGDKTPKSVKARLFSVLWIMIGITFCSILTATLSSALTNVTVERYDVLATKKIGVVRDSIALQEAVNLGVNATVFEDLNEGHNALADEQSVDGILEEMFTSIEYLKQKENPRIAIVHLFEKKHGYGIAFKQHVEDDFGYKIWSCMKKVITFVTDNDIYTVTSRHQIKSKEPTNDQIPEDATSPKAQNIIDQKSPVFIGTVTGLCGVGLMFFIISMALKCLRKGNVHQQSHDLETGRVQGEIPHGNNLGNSKWPQDASRLEFTITELAKGPFTRRK